jgi:succinate dehydrogenase/fumarate reductase flavoprotein subunit
VIAHLPGGTTKTLAYPFTTGTWTCSGDAMTVVEETGGSAITLFATRDSN